MSKAKGILSVTARDGKLIYMQSWRPEDVIAFLAEAEDDCSADQLLLVAALVRRRVLTDWIGLPPWDYLRLRIGIHLAIIDKECKKQMTPEDLQDLAQKIDGTMSSASCMFCLHARFWLLVLLKEIALPLAGIALLCVVAWLLRRH